MTTYGNAGGAAGETYDRITYPGTGGTPRNVDVYYCALEPASAGDCTNYTGPAAQTYSELFGIGSSANKYNTQVVSYVKLPDGRRYEFSYNAYAELTKVKLPTGGAIEYDHGGGGSSGLSTIGYNSAGGTLQVYRRVLQRRTLREDGAVAPRTKYIATYGEGCPTEYLCTKVIEESQNSAGTAAFRQSTQSWAQRSCSTPEICPASIGPYPGSPVDPRVWRSTATLVDTGEFSYTDLAFDGFNNVTSQKEYGFGGAVARETVSSYVTTNVVNSAPLCTPTDIRSGRR